jgi:dimethylargininase
VLVITIVMTDSRKLTGAIVRAPGRSLVAGLTTASLGKPDYALALQQHSAYCEALEGCGLKLTRLEADERFPDSTFIEDTAVVFRSLARDRDSADITAILTRPGAPTRAEEVELSTQVLSQFCRQTFSLEAPGTLDGGDICEANDHFFIGISDRTNEAGAQQLAALLTSAGYTSAFIDIRGEQSILHLKSGLAFIGDNRLVVIDALADRPEFSEFELIRVDAAEEYAANCVRVNDHVLIAAGSPKLERSLQNLGYSTIALEMSEFQKVDGGLSCLSLRY